MKCPACLSLAQALYLPSKKYHLIKCGDCGLVFTDPMPDDRELGDFYQGFNFQKEPASNLLENLDKIKSSLDYFVGRPHGSQRFLDYGGGCGVYTLAASQLGWDAELYDYDREMVDYGKKELGLMHAFADINDLRAGYHLIFAFHVVEHWNDLDRHFQQLLSLLAPDGSVVIATPNAVSIEKKARFLHRKKYLNILLKYGASVAQAKEWMKKTDSITCWDPPRHLFAFTPQSLRALAERFHLNVTIWTGYNSNPIFEPRQYLIPSYEKSMQSFSKEIFNNPFRAIKRLFKNTLNRFCVARLEKNYPDLGEQLYAKFTRR